MAIKQEANAGLIVTVAAISGFLILVLYFGAEAWFRSEEASELTTQWDNNPNAWLGDMRNRQRANLGNLDTAMKQIVQSNGKLTMPAAPATQPATKPVAFTD